MKTLLDYHVVCREGDNGSFIACVPAIDGCHAIGHAPDEAQRELQNVFEMISEDYAGRGQLLPNDVDLTIMPAKARPPGYFANCHCNEEIEESNGLAAHGPKAIIP